MIIGTAIFATTIGVAMPTVAIAAPAPAMTAAEPPASIPEKDKAASVLKILAGPELLNLPDRNFVAALYYAADDLDKPHPLEPDHQKLRETAIAALAADGDAASTQWIKVGIHDAAKEDIRIGTERRQQQQTERAAKARVAETLGIPVDNTVLAKPVFDFIVYLDLKADGHKNMAVKAAARAALAGSAEDQWKFLTVGWSVEHLKDVKRLIDEDAAADEAKKAAMRAKAAKANAVSNTLGSVPPDRLEYLTNLDDRRFVVEIWKALPRGTHVHSAAEEAVGGEAADWTFFINQGAEEAALRDIADELKRRDDEYIRQITELKARTEKQLIRPALVAAAAAALAGKMNDRRAFLTTGQHENLVQTLRVKAHAGLDVYLGNRGGDLVLEQWLPGNQPHLQWKIEPGLSNPECFSFQSVSNPNNYLRAVPDSSAREVSAAVPPSYWRARARVETTDGTPTFRSEATWCVRGTANDVSIHPAQSRYGYLYVTGAVDDDGWDPTSWQAEAPQAPHPVDRRYATEPDLRAKLGKPVGEFVQEGSSNGTNLGYRSYEKGRLYLTADNDGTSQRIAVHAVYNGPILDKLLALGGPNAIGGAMVDQAPGRDGVGQILRVAKPKMGGNNLYIAWSPSTGAHIVFGLIGDTWTASNAELGAHGYPVTDEEWVPGADVRRSRFATGSIYYDRAGGGYIRHVTGEIHRKFVAMGYEATMGYPYMERATHGPQAIPFQRFSLGSIYLTQNGTVAINGEIHKKFAALGYETNELGNPLSDIKSSSDGVGKYVDFALGGSIYWHPSTGAHAVYGPIAARYRALGAERSYLGYPKTDETALPKGSRAVYQNGRIDWSNENGSTVAYRVVAVPHAAIELKGAGSGRCIQTAGIPGEGALNDLAAMELWQCIAGADKQTWDVIHLGNNIYALKNRHSGKCLDLAYGDLNNGSTIAQYQCHYATTEQWEFTTTADATIALRSVHSGKVIEAKGAGADNAVLITQQVDGGQLHQRWTVIPRS